MTAHEGEGLAPEGVAAPLEPSQLVIEIARELYDRFVMGGWEPQDAYPQIERWLAAVSKNLQEELARVQKLFHDLTPGGSEFVNDPDYCAEYLRERKEQQREIAVNAIKRANELEKEITALRFDFFCCHSCLKELGMLIEQKARLTCRKSPR